ncbi:LysE family translocator [Fodinicola acaciae]|uniref:LysE family translocator n=1 Tax=Fodinicola acaciae TaxID=2681555 RepID=UPI0013D856FA|nr:LysE family transporter [Fodinicola acaciae]
MDELTALAVFSLVSSGSPGPNNILLWASGLRFGLGRTVAHIVGTPLGIGAMAVTVAAGVGVFVTTVPAVAFALKLAGSLYLLYLAYRIAVSDAMRRAEIAKPLGVGRAVAFQCVNAKAWIFVLAGISAFRPAGLPVAVGSVLVVATMMIVVLLAAAAWAAGGSVINRVVSNERAHRVISVILAVLLAASVVQLWL